MSASNSASSTAPTFTISIGQPGIFTNDSSVDVSGMINAQIKAAPAGDAIDLVFNPGTYGVGSPILVPSNTSVIGHDATLDYIQQPGSLQNFGLISNADAYFTGCYTYVNQTNGTSATLQTWTGSYDSNTQTMSGSVPGIVDTNISVQGLTFNLGNAHMFGTWMTNCADVYVANNTYVGGVDGNAFVTVINGLVANNLAIGQNNAAFDDWDGPTSITIENNATYMSATPNSGWSVLMNSTPTGDSADPGNAVNDAIVDNLFSTGAQGQDGVNANALSSYGFTTESLIVEQGNIDSLNGMPAQMAMGGGSPMQNLIVENEIISGINNSGKNPEDSQGFVVGGVDSAGEDTTNDTMMLGNIAEGNFANGDGGIMQNVGNNPSTVNNVVTGTFASNSDISSNALAGTISEAGNMAILPMTFSGAVTMPQYDVAAPATILAGTNMETPIAGVAVDDQNENENISVTLTAHFGTISLPSGGVSITSESINGENAYVLTGTEHEINNALSGLAYTTNSAGWDDSIEIIVSNEDGIVADRYLPVIDFSGTESDSSLLTLSSSDLGFLGIQPDVVNGSICGPDFTGGAVLAPSGNNYIAMGTSVSVVLIGTGSDTITGGAGAGYIATGEGTTSVELMDGGNFTIAGGSGVLTLNAATGNNLIESGSGDASVATGSGDNMILGGLGNLSISSGTGQVMIETLPQDGGTLSGTVGIGGGDIYALSGNAHLATTSLASDLIYLGLGSDTLQSGGNDLIYTGAGDAKINASMGGTDFVVGGTGHLEFIGGSNPAIIDPAASSYLVAKAGDMTIAAGGAFNLKIDALASGHRIIVLPGLLDNVTLCGYSRLSMMHDSHETFSAGMAFINLADGTQIEIPDAVNEKISFVHQRISSTSESSMSSLADTKAEPRKWVMTLGASGPSQAASTGLILSNSTALSGFDSVVASLHTENAIR